MTSRAHLRHAGNHPATCDVAVNAAETRQRSGASPAHRHTGTPAREPRPPPNTPTRRRERHAVIILSHSHVQCGLSPRPLPPVPVLVPYAPAMPCRVHHPNTPPATMCASSSSSPSSPSFPAPRPRPGRAPLPPAQRLRRDHACRLPIPCMLGWQFHGSRHVRGGMGLKIAWGLVKIKAAVKSTRSFFALVFAPLLPPAAEVSLVPPCMLGTPLPLPESPNWSQHRIASTNQQGTCRGTR